ncbi:MAG: FAD-dependent monooxygenase [Pleurocapsa sp.]
MTQVVIVGGGPTGATLALLLVRQGITVKLIEAAGDFRRQFRGEALMPSGLNALQEMELWDLLGDIPHKTLDAWEFFLNGRSLFRVDEPIEKNEQPCTLVSQPHLLAKLIQLASTYPKFEFMAGEPVRELLFDGNRRVRGVKLGEKEITAQIVIAADGRNSIIRKQAGLNLKQQSHSIDLLWFKLEAGSLLESKNTFCSILQDRYGFGLFRGSEEQLQIGWGLYRDDRANWQTIDWLEMLSANSPPWLAEHLKAYGHTLSKPILFSVIVGRCDRWWQPGLLLLGDAVHPMSPIRAQGINMALRDVIVAANYLVPLLTQEADAGAIDAVLPLIQQEREPEIIRIQKLQNEEIAQGELLRNSALVRWGASTFTPLIRPLIRASWLKRQKQLRQGVRSVIINQ